MKKKFLLCIMVYKLGNRGHGIQIHVIIDREAREIITVCKRNYFTKVIPYFTTSKFFNSNMQIRQLQAEYWHDKVT